MTTSSRDKEAFEESMLVSVIGYVVAFYKERQEMRNRISQLEADVDMLLQLAGKAK